MTSRSPSASSGDTAGLIHEDTFGEFEIALLRSALRHDDRVNTDPAMGWGGDRLRVYRTPDGPALVWVTVWDAPRYAERFRSQVADPVAARPRAGYHTGVEAFRSMARPPSGS